MLAAGPARVHPRYAGRIVERLPPFPPNTWRGARSLRYLAGVRDHPQKGRIAAELLRWIAEDEREGIRRLVARHPTEAAEEQVRLAAEWRRTFEATEDEELRLLDAESAIRCAVLAITLAYMGTPDHRLRRIWYYQKLEWKLRGLIERGGVR